ncbi:MAG: hypothetical protein AB7K36_01200 [Chloroflexota bacterium]
MSLARQIVMLLDLATEPLSVRTLVAQITALGGDAGADAVHKRMHQMKAAGQARKEGDGWVLVDALPLQNLRAKWAREGQPAQTITQAPAVPPPSPSLRDRIVAALRENPGSTAQQLAEQIGGLAKNEPASTLNILCKQQRVRHEGEWPARRYFAHDGERVKLPRTGKRKKSDADSGLTKPADPSEGAELLEQVETALKSNGHWCTPGFISITMGLDRSAVTKALERLAADGRAVWRFVSTLEKCKQYAHSRMTDDPIGYPEEPAAAPPAPQAIESGPRTDTHGPIAGEGLRELAARDAASVITPPDAPVDRAWPQPTGMAINAAGDPVITVLDLANGIALDIEDLIGRACDQQADYRAIKALAGAAGMVRRAQLELLRAA